jgi:hypothetical protein
MSAQTVVPDYTDGQIYYRSNVVNALPLFQNDSVPIGLPNDLLTIINTYDIYQIEKAFNVRGNTTVDYVYRIYFNNIQTVNSLLSDMLTLSDADYSEKIPLYFTSCTNEATNHWGTGNANSYFMKLLDYCNANALRSSTNVPVRVAVIDNAFNTAHADFNGIYDATNDFDVANNDNDPNPPGLSTNTMFEHGTHCAGTIGARNNNNPGVASFGGGFGTTLPISLIGIKATLDRAHYQFGTTSLFNPYTGIDKAAQNGARIISNSWGSGPLVPMSIAEADALHNTMVTYPNFLMVVAAGNNNSILPTMPAAAIPLSTLTAADCDRILAVGALNADNRKAVYSNYGPWVDIFAPGTDVFSLSGWNNANSTYTYKSGTSMATPMVSAIAGLVAFNNPLFTPIQIKNRIINAGINVNGQNEASLIGNLGSGRIDMVNALTGNASPAITIALSNTHMCMNTSTNEIITVSNLPVGVTVTGINVSIPGGSPSIFNSNSFTVSFASSGVHEVLVQLSLSTFAIYNYRTSITVFSDKLELLSDATNPVCNNSSQTINVKPLVFGNSTRQLINYSFQGVLNSFSVNARANHNGEGRLINNITTQNPLAVFNNINYFTTNVAGAEYSLATCPLVDVSYQYSTVCCDANTIINSNVNAGMAGFTTQGNSNGLVDNVCNEIEVSNSSNPFTQFSNASVGNYLLYNGPFDKTNINIPALASAIPANQNLVYTPLSLLNATHHIQSNLEHDIWNQGGQNLVTGKDYTFNFSFFTNNIGNIEQNLPMVIQVKISNGINTILLPKKTFVYRNSPQNPNGIIKVNYNILNFPHPTGSYSIAIQQVDNYAVWDFDSKLDDFALQLLQTKPCDFASQWQQWPPNNISTPNNYYSVINPITINTNTIWTDIDMAITSPTAQITVNNGATLTIDQCRLHGCSNIWPGIRVLPGGKIILRRNAMIEDAAKAVHIVAPNTSTITVMDVQNCIFNKNQESIVIENYSPNVGSYPFKVNKSVFTSRIIPVTACLPPNWTTQTALMQATVLAPNANLESPYKLMNLPFVAVPGVLNAFGQPDCHIRLKRVGFTGGTLASPIIKSFELLNNDLDFNLFDNAFKAITLENSNATFGSNVYQNGFSGIYTEKTGTTANGTGQLPYYSLKTLMVNKNKFFDIRYNMWAANYTWYNIQGCDIRSTKDVANYDVINWPPYPSNWAGYIGMYFPSSYIARLDVLNNQIYNQYNGILAYSTQGVPTSGYFTGIQNIISNTIWDKPTGNTLSSPYIGDAIVTGFNNSTTLNTLATIANPTMNIQSNNIKGAFRGINAYGFKWNYQSLKVQDNTIVLKIDPNTNTLGTQHGIWVANSMNLHCKSNNVTGITPTATTFAGNKRQTNYRLDNNQKQVITCNTSNFGSLGFEFNGPSSAPNTQWIQGNVMTNAHFYGYLLNNGAIIGNQPASTLTPMGNSFNFTPFSINGRHSYTDNTQALNSKIYVTSGLPWQPSLNGTNAINWQYTNAVSIFTLTTAALTGCAVAPIAGNTTVINSGGTGQILTGGTVFDTKNVELNYVAKLMIYKMQRNDAGFVNSTPDMQAFYNIANAPTHPYRQMLDIEDDINNANYTAAQTKVNAFVSTNAIELNQRSYYNIAIKKGSGTPLTAEDNTELLRIAKACPHTEGECVYQERVMYNTLNTATGADYYCFTDDCDASGLYRQAPELENLATFTASVYPNPTKGGVYISTQNEKGKTIQVTITDITGKTLVQQSLLLINQTSYMETKLPHGLYLITIKNQNNESVTEKLIIN